MRGDKGKRLGLVAWLAPLGAAGLVAAFDTRDPADLPYFADAARVLFSSRWADTFADPSLQVGPLQLALVGAGDWIGGLSFLAYAIEVGLAALLVFVVGRLLAGRPHRHAVQAGVGLAAVALGLTADAYGYGHPAQMGVPLLWVLAALEAREGRMGRSGLLLGLGAGLEPWAVLGAPVLLLCLLLRRAATGLGVLVVVVATLYLPFVLAGDFGMLEHRWKVEGWTLVRTVLPLGSEFPWTLRLVQGAAAIAVGAALALALRRSTRGVWAVPLVVIAIRLLLDPTLYSWYWVGAETVVLVAVAELLTSVPIRWQHWLRAPGSLVGDRRG